MLKTRLSGDINTKLFLEHYVIPLKKFRTPELLERFYQKKKNVRLQAIICLQKIIDLLAPYFDEEAKKSLYAKMQWTDIEIINQFKKSERDVGYPFSEVVLSRIRDSIAGTFIEEFNEGVSTSLDEKEMMLSVAELSLKNKKDYPCMERENDIVDNLVKILRNMVQVIGDGKITLEKFFKVLTHLRIQDSKVKYLDIGMRQLNTLQILILSGNSIEELPIHNLPRSLRVLELNNNFISHIKVSNGNPPPLIFLGLSCNCFCDDSDIQGLKQIKTLLVLDLSDNNIILMTKILNQLKEASQLMSLSLRGNPCSTMISYKDFVKESLPKLEQLDGAMIRLPTTPVQEIPGKEWKLKKIEQKCLVPPPLRSSAELRIYVLRLMGIPKPPATNKLMKRYLQFEVELPLLDNKLLIREKCHLIFQFLKTNDVIPNPDLIAEKLIAEEEEEEELQEHIDRLSKESNKEQSRAAPKGDKMHRKKEPWEIAYDEFLSKDNEMQGARKHISEKLNWSIVMKPSNPIINIQIEWNKLLLLRNTLRSIIIIRLYYKEEGTKGGVELIYNKKLIAKISVPAEVPIWAEEYSCYEWNAKKPQMAHLEPEILNMKFAPAIKGTQKIKGILTQPIPNFPTCHLGISLQRSAR